MEGWVKSASSDDSVESSDLLVKVPEGITGPPPLIAGGNQYCCAALAGCTGEGCCTSLTVCSDLGVDVLLVLESKVVLVDALAVGDWTAMPGGEGTIW